jgi:hypothetical protein
VWRAVFADCFDRFAYYAQSAGSIGRVDLEKIATSGRAPGRRSTMYGLKAQEYCADFCLIAARVLNEHQHRVFKFHFLLGADWKLCCKRLGIERGEFFHDVYRIQQKLGRAYAECEPHALWPVGEYFGGVIEKNTSTRPATQPLTGVARNFPLAVAA